MKPASYQVEFTCDYDLTSLAAEWQALESRSSASFFLSWTWISTWLESVAPLPVLVRVRAGSEIVALGLLAQATIVRHYFVRSRQWHLHQSGDGDLDRIATEFNGFLVRRDCEEEVISEIFRQLRSRAWDECVFPGVPARYQAFAKQAGYACVVDHKGPNFIVDLSHLRERKADLSDSLSHNSRAQLRRALRLAAAEGPLSVDPATDVDQALSYFAGLKQLDRWERKGQAGAFATRARETFHRRLIARGLAGSEVQLLRVCAGPTILGYLYQFCYRGRVLAYQAAYTPGRDNRHRPGLVMHYLAIERALAQGANVYDFLEGQARYKQSLGRQEENLIWLRMQKPRPAFTLERIGRRLRGAL